MAQPIIIDNSSKSMDFIVDNITAADEAFAQSFKDLKNTIEKNSQGQITEKTMQTLLEKHFGEIPSKLVTATIKSLEDGKLKEALRLLAKNQRVDASKEKSLDEKKNISDNKTIEKQILDYLKDQDDKFSKTPEEKKIIAETLVAKNLSKAVEELEKTTKKTNAEKELDNISKLKTAKSNLKSHSLFSKNGESTDDKILSKLMDQTKILGGKALQKFATTSIGSKIGSFMVGKKEQSRYSIDSGGRYRRKDEEGKSKIISKKEYEESSNFLLKAGKTSEMLGKESGLKKEKAKEEYKEAERKLLYGPKKTIKKSKDDNELGLKKEKTKEQVKESEYKIYETKETIKKSKESNGQIKTDKNIKEKFKEIEKPLDKSKGFTDIAVYLKSIENSTKKSVKVQQDIYNVLQKKNDKEYVSFEGRMDKDTSKNSNTENNDDDDDSGGFISDWWNNRNDKNKRGKRKRKTGKIKPKGKTPRIRGKGKLGMITTGAASLIGIGSLGLNRENTDTGGNLAEDIGENIAQDQAEKQIAKQAQKQVAKQATKQVGKQVAKQAGQQVIKQGGTQVARQGLMQGARTLAQGAGGTIAIPVVAGIAAGVAIQYQKEEIAQAEAESLAPIGDRKFETKKALIRQLKKAGMNWKIANKVDDAKNDAELTTAFNDVMSQIKNNKKEAIIKEKNNNVTKDNITTPNIKEKLEEAKIETTNIDTKAEVMNKNTNENVKEIGASTEAEAQKAKATSETGKIMINQSDVLMKILELVEIIAKKEFTSTTYSDSTSGPRYNQQYVN